MLHGMFHRVQPELGLITDDGFNEHLDTLEGRVWMLEWRALRRAIESSGNDRAGRSPMRWPSDANAALAFPERRRANGARRFAKGLPRTPGIAAWADSPANARRAAAEARKVAQRKAEATGPLVLVNDSILLTRRPR